MRILYLACGDAAHIPSPEELSCEVLRLPEIPQRKDLKPLDDAARAALPVDPTPSLQDIAQRPDVEHLGEPQRAPQQPEEELRFVVAGSDASLSAILTRMMRGDYLWATVAYIPTDPSSPAATNWSLPRTVPELLALAASDEIHPVPLIRSDSGVAVAGSATVSDSRGGAMLGEIVVDDEMLLKQLKKPRDARFFSQFGAKLVPTTHAPGLAAVRLTTPLTELEPIQCSKFSKWIGRHISDQIGPIATQSWFETPALRWLVKGAPVRLGGVDPRSILSGRALQAGGFGLLATIDGVPAPRVTERVVFYRHLRDLQILRPH